MKTYNFVILIIVFVFGFFTKTDAQETFINNLSKQQEKQIDSLFTDWGEASKPGVIAAILYNNQLVYQKSFGSANIERQSPIKKDTKFQISGMAKHFVAFAILFLEHQKKLSLSDDIRNHIPQLSHLSESISILDLLHHADGLYDYNALKTIAGKPYDFQMSNTGVLDMLNCLNSLNFKPGTDYINSDTSIILLTEVIKKVAGMGFSDFMNKEIFEPIGMLNTSFVESKNTLLFNLATPYMQTQNKFVLGETFEKNYGVSNMFSTSEDLVKWELNMINPRIGNKELYTKLNSIVTLDNGKKFSISLGNLTLGQQFTHKERGLTSTYHTGQFGGFASSMFRFPEQEYAAIVLSNNGLEYNGYFGVLAAHILLKDYFPEPPSIDVSTLNVKPISEFEKEKFNGTYWDQKGGFYRTLKVENDTLQYIRTNGYTSPLLYLGNNKFQMVLDFDDKIFVHFYTDGDKERFSFINGEAEPIIFEKFELKELDANKASLYIGTYYSSDLQIGYDIHYENKKLVLYGLGKEKNSLTPIKDELFHGDQWYLRSITFQKNSKGIITGFNTSIEEVDGIWFKKIESFSK